MSATKGYPITVPRHLLKKRAKKLRKKSRQPAPVERSAKNSLLVIACKRKEYNHYQGSYIIITILCLLDQLITCTRICNGMPMHMCMHKVFKFHVL